jgi:hypothetical protein
VRSSNRFHAGVFCGNAPTRVYVRFFCALVVVFSEILIRVELQLLVTRSLPCMQSLPRNDFVWGRAGGVFELAAFELAASVMASLHPNPPLLP